MTDLEKEAITIASKIGKLKDWYPFEFRAILGGIVCKGAVCPLVARGKRKGEPNYRKMNKLTVSEVFVPSHSRKAK